jgi:hypothetical protein
LAKAKITIEHPRPDNNETVMANFVAWGETEGPVATLVALVIDSRGKIKLGTLLQGPPHWGFRFKGVSRGEALLLVFDPLGFFTTPPALSRFTAVPPPKMLDSTGQIYYPPAGTAQNPTLEPTYFWADGAATCSSVIVKLLGNSGSVTTGTIDEPPPNWSCTFNVTDNPVQDPYTVKLTDGSGNQLDQHPFIQLPTQAPPPGRRRSSSAKA